MVGRSAAAAAFPEMVGAPGGADVALEVTVATRGGGAAEVSARVIDGEQASEVLSLGAEAAGPVWTDDAGRGLLHLDLPGLLSVSVDRDGRVLYARTSLLGRFGLAGGRYEVAGRRG